MPAICRRAKVAAVVREQPIVDDTVFQRFEQTNWQLPAPKCRDAGHFIVAKVHPDEDRTAAI
jgi:hypothetical protein